MVLEENFTGRSFEPDEHQVDAGQPEEKQRRAEEELVCSFKMPYQQSFRQANWFQPAEAALPLKASALTSYGGLASPLGLAKQAADEHPSKGPTVTNQLLASLESHSKKIAKRLIQVNLISLLVNLLLAALAFWFSFANNSSATSAFAADCLLDVISSAIVLWRYHGDLNSVHLEAREQIACIYLGALFELSALGIIIKASSDIASGAEPSELSSPGYDLIYLAATATIAFVLLIVFKWSLYKAIRDKSILLDVINTIISTVFALTLCLMTVLSNFDSSFWYFDPVLSIVLALFMAGFGLKVIHQNFHVLRPSSGPASPYAPLVGFDGPDAGGKLPLLDRNQTGDFMAGLLVGNQRASSPNGANPTRHYETNLNASLDYSRANWQKADHSSIVFV